MTSKTDAYKPNAAVLRAEQTTKVAFEHIAAETAARHEKQRLLKAARLKRDMDGAAPDAAQAEPKAKAKVAVKAPRKKRTA